VRSAALLFAVALPVTLSLTACKSHPAREGREVRQRTTSKTRRVTLFYTGDMQGTLEPCGCNSDPLGGIERYAALVSHAAEQTSTLVLDAGNLLYPRNGVPERKLKAAQLRAEFLATQLAKMGLVGSTLGLGDLVAGDTLFPRLAANALQPPDERDAKTKTRIRASALVEAGGLHVGILGLGDPGALEAAGLQHTDAQRAARVEAERLRNDGADLVIVTTTLPRRSVRRIMRQAPIDFAILGTEVAEGLPFAEPAGSGFIVAAADEGRRIGRLDIIVPRGSQDGARLLLTDAGSQGARALEAEKLATALSEINKEIATWRASAAEGEALDETFLKRKETRRAALAQALEEARKPWAPPTGSHFTNRLISIRRALPQDKDVLAAMRTLDAAIAKVNLAQAEPPPEAEPGRAFYVGDAACATHCHQDERVFWQKTIHAKAWKTLVDGGKQHDLECVGCHVTGFGEVGGSALGFTQRLESVQCEVCHGPGSLHVEEEGLEEPPAIRLETPQQICVQCHNEKHSDTFEYEAYLRDIVGEGHGRLRREALGEGPTGHELRSAAMAKAKAAGMSSGHM